MNTGNNTLSLAFDALSAGDYQHAFTLCNEAIDQGISEDWKVGRAEALNMRGTFRFLLGDSQGAKEDFEKSLDLVPDYVQSLVKVASVHMELGDAAGAFGDFETAIRHNPDDPDIYYHRGQRESFSPFPRGKALLPADVPPGVLSPPPTVYFVTNEYEKASADYEKSTSLDDKFVFSHVQHAVAQYKMSQTKESMASFRKILKLFPTNFEPLNY
jgi:import receptor subunit TOM70